MGGQRGQSAPLTGFERDGGSKYREMRKGKEVREKKEKGKKKRGRRDRGAEERKGKKNTLRICPNIAG